MKVLNLKFSNEVSKEWRVLVPGSKSYTNRALVLAALSEDQSILRGISQSADSQAMISALSQLGCEIQIANGDCLISGGQRRLRLLKAELDVGPAGTTFRFLTALIAALPGTDVILKGSPRMHARPIGDLVTALRHLGADITFLRKDGFPPLKIRGKELAGGSVEVAGTLSSQYFSALMLIAALLKNGIEIKVRGEQISRSYIDMSIASLNAAGIEIKNDNYRQYNIAAGQMPKRQELKIESDASGATYFFALAALARRKIMVGNLSLDSAQGDVQFPKILQQMGCRLDTIREGCLSYVTIQGSAELKAIEVNLQLLPDSAQTLAVVAACASGTSTLSGLSTLRIKETDRIQALVAELAKCGIVSTAGKDYLRIQGGKPKSARIATYEDHRMAMSFATLVAQTGEMQIEEPDVVSKSFPEFWELMRKCGVATE